MMSHELHNRESMSDRGFTLTELLVAMTIAGILSAAILALFNSTSNSLYQADSLASVVDRARFSLERLRTEVQAAGAFGTPDSSNDPMVRPKPALLNRSFQVAGLVSYTDWQDNTPAQIPGTNCRSSDGSQASCSTADLRPSFDGFVVMGALNYPVTFELSDVSSSGNAATAVASRRGLLKLANPDPLTRAELTPVTSGNATTEYPQIASDASSSILRVMNPNTGEVQFGAIESVSDTTGSDGTIGLTFEFEAGHALYRQRSATGDAAGTQTGDMVGLPAASESSGDENYPGTAMIDAYWYYVDRDPENPDNFQLLRQRIDASELAKQMSGSSGSADWTSLSSSVLEGYGVDDPVVIADRVVDFQFWVDCAEASGSVKGLSWEQNWQVPAGGTGDTGHACLAPADPKPGLARMAHVRLSMRSARESPNLRQQPFSGTGSGPTNMGTYDVDPNVQGKARVATVQADVELTSFAVRGITAGATTN
jgi:prepilin-type N-terminal cleavage/methylation domain-containing protein